jgi:hypothetical protein
MSEHQTYLRCHIQLFCATMDDVTAPVRGRTKNVQLGQVGIQCCHCAHLPLSDRINGAVYFPATTNGIYQASLNMGAMHLQCGRCPQMPDAMKQHFAKLLGAKNMPSMVGRKYWAKTAIEMFGLVDTEHGIFVNSRAPAAA